ncbi:MAG: general secretion pathway protein GspC [Deltaproteobacteria bacterium]|nr:general secretion pathway protein GspC [Deltaproteobacteria bacterium]
MAFDQLLKKNFWIVVLPLVAIAALLNAQAITQLVGIGLAPDEKQLSAAPPVARVAPSGGSSTRSPSADPILSRNPFDHVTGSLKPPVVDDTAATATVSNNEDPWAAPMCDGVKVLVIAASSDKDWSFAALSVNGESKSTLRRRGDEVGGKKIEFVGWDRVWFLNGGARCQALLWKPGDQPAAKPAAAPAETAPPPPTKGGAPALAADLQKGIQKISATEFNIDRGVVDKILENQSELMRQARIVPEQENGKTVGIRLFGVRPDTLLGVLGMENGDRLQTINGFDMASPEKALEAYARLRTADKLTVQVNRRGQNMNLDYNIK